MTTDGSSDDESFFIKDLRSSSNDTFNGFSDAYNFTVTILVQLTFGLGLVVLSIYPNLLTGLFASLWIIGLYRWLQNHGQKMTRKEVVFFETRNLLEVDPPVFRFGLPANVDDCLTPGDGEQREPPQPQTLWDALFTDEKTIEMEKFYRKHYGGVHSNAQKKFQEYEMEKAKEREKEKCGKKESTSPKSS